MRNISIFLWPFFSRFYGSRYPLAFMNFTWKSSKVLDLVEQADINKSVSHRLGVLQKVSYFGGARQQAPELSKMIVDPFPPPPLGLAVSFRGSKGLSVHDFLCWHLAELGVEARKRTTARQSTNAEWVRYEPEVIWGRSIIGKLLRTSRPPIEQTTVWWRWRK